MTMDILELPSLPKSAKIETVWRMLEETQREALVTKVKGRPMLLTAASLIRAKNAGHEILEQVDGRALEVRLLPSSPAGPYYFQPISATINPLLLKHAVAHSLGE